MGKSCNCNQSDKNDSKDFGNKIKRNFKFQKMPLEGWKTFQTEEYIKIV